MMSVIKENFDKNLTFLGHKTRFTNELTHKLKYIEKY
jgi:hypothetical protein